MSDRSVTFATNVWENGWLPILTTDRLAKAIKRCRSSFSDRLLTINNVFPTGQGLNALLQRLSMPGFSAGSCRLKTTPKRHCRWQD